MRAISFRMFVGGTALAVSIGSAGMSAQEFVPPSFAISSSVMTRDIDANI